jgi:hypothetical protein
MRLECVDDVGGKKILISILRYQACYAHVQSPTHVFRNLMFM